MNVATQIGGKYHKDDDSLFKLKQHLRAANIVVSHPIADAIVASANGQGYAFDPAKSTFYDVEVDYYHSIAHSNFHTVNNTFSAQHGYVGASAALEIGYAMLCQRPIILRYSPQIKPGIDPLLVNVLENNTSHFYVCDLLALTPQQLQELVKRLPEKRHYALTGEARQHISRLVHELFVTLSHEQI